MKKSSTKVAELSENTILFCIGIKPAITRFTTTKLRIIKKPITVSQAVFLPTFYKRNVKMPHKTAMYQCPNLFGVPAQATPLCAQIIAKYAPKVKLGKQLKSSGKQSHPLMSN